VRLRAAFDNADGSLMPGQFARLRLGRAESDPVLLVSERAVGTDQDKRYVMVVGADDKAAYREVMLGASVEGLRVVTQGLKPGDRVIVNGLQTGFMPGMPVAPKLVAMRASPVNAAVAIAAPR
jgi:multidrug efflux system membrane fusion protein